MKIQFPITILFDAMDARTAGFHGRRTFTMRYDPADTDAPAEYCRNHPPRQGDQWVVDKDGVLFDLFQHDTCKLIEARALADPEGYGIANDNDSLDDVDRAVAVVAREIEAVE